MRRYWFEGSLSIDQQCELVGDLYHHIFSVCRQEEGSQFELIAQDEKAYVVEVLAQKKKSAVAKALSVRTLPALPKPWITLALSIGRFPVMDSVVERCVELGVKDIRPFYSDFSFIRKAEMFPAGRLERWQKLAKMACQQSGRGQLLKLHTPVPAQNLFSDFNPNKLDLGLFAYEGESGQPIKNYLKSFKTQSTSGAQNTESIWLFVGSEGGFSQNEVQMFLQKGLKPVTLGEQVLRVETACLALVSVLKYEFDLMT